jgi:hypothetical protein
MEPEVIFDPPQAVFPQQRDARRRMSHLKNLMMFRSGSFATGASQQQIKLCARCPESRSSRAPRLLEALDTQQNFEPFRLAEACD